LTNSSDIFEWNGPIAQTLDRFERRKAQVVMAKAVEETIEKGGIILAEAGTGTGKTLAYLVPAILSDRTVIVSTGTKNLQEQIFFKDIRFLEKALNTSIEAVYLKGQDNYLCLRRFYNFMRSPRALAHSPTKVSDLEKWAEQTETGDRMEMEGLADSDPLWREICSTRETRIGSKCKFADACFLTKARIQAAQAKIVVVNHHLYFADLSTRLRGGSVLPAHEVVIFDEAHEIENVATEFFSITVSSRRIDGILDNVTASVKAARFQDDPAATRRQKLIVNVKEASRELFSKFKGSLGRERLVPEEMGTGHLSSYHRLDTALEAVELSLTAVEGRDDMIDHGRDTIKNLRTDLSTVISQTVTGYVHWIDNRKRAVILGASPIDISHTLREGIFFSIPTAVLTSATLSTSGNFDFLKNRLGLDFDVTELSLPSPFDYSVQACLYVPNHLPDPRDSEFAPQLAAEAMKLIAITEGGALLLFTSVRNMQLVHGILETQLSGSSLLLQGTAPKSLLLAQFTRNHHAVLCATASFWQGVDVPGHALRLVIIDKLPFSSPGDPLTAARIDFLADQGHNPFIDYQVPEAALFLKQGFGRLIRTQNDRGIVSIMDKRLHTARYAKIFLNSLPTCPRPDNLEAVAKWWGLTSGRSPQESGES
jgi:ATP-dependent DNA helicase DinG